MRHSGPWIAGLAALAALTLATSSSLADVLYLKDGQSIDGTYLGGTPRLVRFRVNGIIRTYMVNEIQEIQFGPDMSASGSTRQPASTPAPVSSQSGTLRRAAASNEYLIPSGTVLRVRTGELIDSDAARVGDVFNATLDQNLVVDRELIAEHGSAAKLRLAQVEEAGEFKGRTVLTIDLIEMAVGNSLYSLTATPVEQRGEGQGKRAGTAVGGGAALGAIIGAIAGGGKGAAIGAAVGAAGGAGVQVLTRGERLKIPAETVLEFSLQQDLFLRR